MLLRYHGLVRVATGQAETSAANVVMIRTLSPLPFPPATPATANNSSHTARCVTRCLPGTLVTLQFQPGDFIAAQLVPERPDVVDELTGLLTADEREDLDWLTVDV